jgi:hypothetical protein
MVSLASSFPGFCLSGRLGQWFNLSNGNIIEAVFSGQAIKSAMTNPAELLYTFGEG